MKPMPRSHGSWEHIMAGTLAFLGTTVWHHCTLSSTFQLPEGTDKEKNKDKEKLSNWKKNTYLAVMAFGLNTKNIKPVKSSLI